jgi:epoxyqueuosine reductase
MIKETALALGADLVGIGSMDRFAGAPPDHDPRFIFPEAKSIIGLGFRIHRGVLRGPEEGVAFGMYGSEGYANTNNAHIPLVLRELGSFIEDRGYDAVLYGQGHRHTWGPTGHPVRPGYPKPDVLMHVRIAGVICGLGEIGWSKIFLTKKLGPRQRLAFIFTDAELETDPIQKPGTLCDRCMRCARECPSRAIPTNPEEKEEVTIAGQTISWGKLRETRCFIGFQAPGPEKNPFLGKEMDGGNPETRRLIEEALAAGDSKEDDAFRMKVRSHVEQHFRPSSEGNKLYHYTAAVCGASCMRTCMVHLEQQGKLTDTFHTPFRIRKPWKIDYEGTAGSPPG